MAVARFSFAKARGCDDRPMALFENAIVFPRRDLT
jgi:hypothetical protein